MSDFYTKLTEEKGGIYLYGTTTPKQTTSKEKQETIAKKFAKRVSELEVDGIVIYDVQDESARIKDPRPFPYVPGIDSALYSKMLIELSNKPTITYKSVVQRSKDEFTSWLDFAKESGIRSMILVGTPSPDQVNTLPLADAQNIVKQNAHFIFGGVTIAERHEALGDEHLRLLAKIKNGCQFFISQAIYDAPAQIKLFEDYYNECQKQDEKPKRVCLTFSPCGFKSTLHFMKWLGVSIPEKVEKAIIESDNPVEKSIEICKDNLLQIMETAKKYDIPLGLNIESVSIKKAEKQGAIDLFKLLQREMKAFNKE